MGSPFMGGTLSPCRALPTPQETIPEAEWTEVAPAILPAPSEPQEAPGDA